MLRIACIAIVSAVLVSIGAAAEAESNRAAPRFTLAEEVIIARNDALNDLLRVDPLGVRKVLDALAVVKRLPPADRPNTEPGKKRDVLGDPRLREGDFRIDPLQNPDLNILFQRASPEAAYDLFQILKRVGSRSIAN